MTAQEKNDNYIRDIKYLLMVLTLEIALFGGFICSCISDILKKL